MKNFSIKHEVSRNKQIYRKKVYMDSIEVHDFWIRILSRMKINVGSGEEDRDKEVNCAKKVNKLVSVICCIVDLKKTRKD